MERSKLKNYEANLVTKVLFQFGPILPLVGQNNSKIQSSWLVGWLYPLNVQEWKSAPRSLESTPQRVNSKFYGKGISKVICINKDLLGHTAARYSFGLTAILFIFLIFTVEYFITDVVSMYTSVVTLELGKCTIWRDKYMKEIKMINVFFFLSMTDFIESFMNKSTLNSKKYKAMMWLKTKRGYNSTVVEVSNSFIPCIPKAHSSEDSRFESSQFRKTK